MAYETFPTTPTQEDCSQVGSRKYDYRTTVQLEISVMTDYIKRRFPAIPAGVTFGTKSNPHDFGSYYEIKVNFDDNNEDHLNYIAALDEDWPEYWDGIAKLNLTAASYPIPFNE